MGGVALHIQNKTFTVDEHWCVNIDISGGCELHDKGALQQGHEYMTATSCLITAKLNNHTPLFTMWLDQVILLLDITRSQLFA